MSNSNFWSNKRNNVENTNEQINYLLITENNFLKKEIDSLREQLFEAKAILSKMRMSLELIRSIIEDNVYNKIDFIREVMNEKGGF